MKKISILILSLFLPAFLYSQNETFSAFDVQPCTGNIVIAQWRILPAADSLYFEVERSADSILWTRIARVAADDSHQYLYIDANPKDGINYYRIRQVSDMKTVFSSTVKWVQVDKMNEFYIWPNPAKNVLHVRTPFEEGSMEIIDPGGKLILKFAITNYITDVVTECLSKGVYVIQVRNGNEVLTEKFIKA